MTALAAILAACVGLFLGLMVGVAALLHWWASHDCWDGESSDRISDTAAEMPLADAEAGA